MPVIRDYDQSKAGVSETLSFAATLHFMIPDAMKPILYHQEVEVRLSSPSTYNPKEDYP